ncbi:MAG TPA: anti-sigma factor antagonist [Roseiflexaceae bacterium]|nr:anti-sigma factor antagonist [Roseiflexaceae bacterium]
MAQLLRVPATLDSLAHISAFINDAAGRVGLDDHSAWQVELAVDEAATNIIQHACDPGQPGEIELSWRVESDWLVVTLRDWGDPFDPSSIPAPDITSPLEERQAGGLGIFLMNRLMDSVSFEFDTANGNLLTMTKRLHSAAEPPQIVTLGGRLDAQSTNQALSRVRATLGAGTSQVLLDMSGVTFMSSSGLRALLLLRRELLAQGGELRLCALQPQVREVFALTGFTQVFAIHDTRDDALAAFAQEHA